MMSLEDAVRTLRKDPSNAALVRDTYLDEDVVEAAERYARSAEFAEILATVGALAKGKVVDLGAGRGIASYAFSKTGAESVYAVEPDFSNEVGLGAISELCSIEPLQMIAAVGGSLPIRDGQIDLVFVRQVLHHVPDLNRVLGECARVLRSGGLLLAAREHVVDDEAGLRTFLANHPLHRLSGGENAYRLDAYLGAIRSSGLVLQTVLGPWDSVINAFPAVQTQSELNHYAVAALRRRLGGAGRILARYDWVESLTWRYLKRPVPGRLYSFGAVKE